MCDAQETQDRHAFCARWSACAHAHQPLVSIALVRGLAYVSCPQHPSSPPYVSLTQEPAPCTLAPTHGRARPHAQARPLALAPVRVRACVHVCAHLPACVHLRACACVCVHAGVCAHAHACACVYACVCVCVRAYAHLRPQARAHGRVRNLCAQFN